MCFSAVGVRRHCISVKLCPFISITARLIGFLGRVSLLKGSPEKPESALLYLGVTTLTPWFLERLADVLMRTRRQLLADSGI